MDQSQLNDAAWAEIAGVDPHGNFRVKVVSYNKLCSGMKNGFAFSSGPLISDSRDGFLESIYKDSVYPDLLFRIDPNSQRKLPWKHDRPFFLGTFHDPGTKVESPACPRAMIRRLSSNLKQSLGLKAIAGIEFEFCLFTSELSDAIISPNHSKLLFREQPLSYSAIELSLHEDFVRAILLACAQVDCPLESFHVEMGGAAAEAALAANDCCLIADRAVLFRLVMHTIGSLAKPFKIRPTFMAKPLVKEAGSSGHIHLSLVDYKTEKNVFARHNDDDLPCEYSDLANISKIGRQFLAGVLHAIPDLMPLMCPNINSYKRLQNIKWAPVTASWGFENRLSLLRVIAPPTCDAESTRFELRIPGADLVPHHALSGLIGAGLWGIETEAEVPVAPNSLGVLLPTDLKTAVQRFQAPNSLAATILGAAAVEHIAELKMHEVELFERAVTDW